MHYSAILDRYPIVSDQATRPRLNVVLRELERVLEQGIPGDIAEFGCYIGTTSLFIRRLLNELTRGRSFYAYDSFAGLPAKTKPDESSAGAEFKSGELTISKREFLQTFHRANLVPPVTHKAWFKDLEAAQLPDALAFAFLDGDFYESILDSFKLAWPRLERGGVLTVDDYQREALPGVTAAVRDFFGGTPENLRFEHTIAIIKKL
jgi:O-methyltransferase